MNARVSDPSGKARDAVERIIAVCDTIADLTRMSIDDFVADTRSQWAVEMGLIRVGEGVNRIPAEVLAEFDAQPWRQIVAMRNFAAHQYDDLEPRRVWRTATVDVADLRTYLATVVLEALS